MCIHLISLPNRADCAQFQNCECRPVNTKYQDLVPSKYKVKLNKKLKTLALSILMTIHLLFTLFKEFDLPPGIWVIINYIYRLSPKLNCCNLITANWYLN